MAGTSAATTTSGPLGGSRRSSAASHGLVVARWPSKRAWKSAERCCSADEGLGRGFFSVAVGQLLAVGVEDLPHLGAGSQHDIATGADAAGGVGDLFPHEAGADPVGLQDGGQRDSGGCSAASVLA